MSQYSASQGLDFSVKTRWFVVANRTGAVIYKDGRESKFHFVERLSNKKGDLSEADLVSDKPGTGISNGGDGTIHHGLDRRFNHHEQTAKNFARRIAASLEQAHREGRFRDLVLVAEPHFLGLLRNELGTATRKSVVHEIHREYAQGSDEELRSQILHAIESEV